MLTILVPSPNKVGYLAQSIGYFLFLVFHSLSYKRFYLLPHFFFSSPNGDCLRHEVSNKSVSPKLSFKWLLTLGTQQKFIGLKLISIQIVATIVTWCCLLKMPASIFSFQTNHPHISKQNLSPNSPRVLYLATSDLTELLELFQNRVTIRNMNSAQTWGWSLLFHAGPQSTSRCWSQAQPGLSLPHPDPAWAGLATPQSWCQASLGSHSLHFALRNTICM